MTVFITPRDISRLDLIVGIRRFDQLQGAFRRRSLDFFNSYLFPAVQLAFEDPLIRFLAMLRESTPMRRLQRLGFLLVAAAGLLSASGGCTLTPPQDPFSLSHAAPPPASTPAYRSYRPPTLPTQPSPSSRTPRRGASPSNDARPPTPSSPKTFDDPSPWTQPSVVPPARSRSPKPVTPELPPLNGPELSPPEDPLSTAKASLTASQHDSRVELVVEVPDRRPVGSGAPLALTVRNRGNQILRNVSVVCEFPQGLRFPGSDRPRVVHKIPRIDPGDVKESLLTLVGETPGRHACRFTVHVGSQPVVTRTVTVEFVSRQLDWHIDGPEERTVGSRAEFNIPLINVSRTDLRDLTVRVDLDAALTVREMTQGGKLADRSVTWTIERLAANEGILLQLEVECREITQEACLKVSVAGQGLPEDSNEACLLVQQRTGWLNVRVEDVADPVAIGEETELVVTVDNQGLQPIRDIAVTCTWPNGFELIRAAARQGDRLRPLHAEVRGTSATLSAIPRLAPDEALEYRLTLKAKTAGSHRFLVEVNSSSDRAPLQVIEPVMVHR